jgi:hypothetical protein
MWNIIAFCFEATGWFLSIIFCLIINAILLRFLLFVIPLQYKWCIKYRKYWKRLIIKFVDETDD